MRKSNREVNGEKVFRYSIRKYHFGAASVAVAALMFFANGAVKADTLPVSPATANTEKVNAGVTDLTEGVPLEKSLETEGNKEIVAPEPAAETSNKEDGAGSNAQGANEIKVSDKDMIPANQTEEINKAETNIKEEAIANKDKLEALLNEIDKLNLKTYTEESVKVLQQKVAKAKEVLVNAKTQKEIDSAYNELVAYKSSGLKRVPKLKENNTPKPDTTGGKETVGKKAENTEPNGTNIAGHNHSLAGTTLPEGSGFRTAPAGDVTFYLLDGSMETEAGRAPDARYILKFRRGQGYIPQYSSATTTGAYLDYTGQRREGEFILRTFATRGSNAEVGTYDFRLRFTDSKTGEVYVDQSLRVNVKPNKPTVTVENLENAAGKRAVVNSTARNSNDSVVEFYLNNIKKATITAVNGKASWMPDEALQAGDRITTKNIARDRERIPATYGGDINVARSTSEMSNAVTIPVPVAPKVNLDEVKRQAKESIATAATQETDEINNDNSLTSTQKTEKIKLVETAKNDAETAITNASDADKVETAKTTGVANIGNVHTQGNLDEVKRQAKESIATAATQETDEINNDNSLTSTQKTEKIKLVETAKNDAETAITNASDADKVETAKTTGVTAIKAVHTVGNLDDVKATAKANLATVAAEEKAEIAGDKSLTVAQRAEKEKAVDTTKAAEEAKITAADDADKVEAAKTAGVTAIKAVHTVGSLDDVKAAAKADLATVATEEKAEIAGDKSLTAAQRAEKEKAVDTTKAAEEAKITAADDADKVEAAKTAGVAAIKAVHTAGDLNAVKNAAKAALESAAAEEKAEIAGDKSLTAAQRAEKEKAVDTTKAAEEAKITAADNADKVATAKTAGVAAIKAVHTVGSLDDVKAAAKASLESAAAEEKAEIAGDKSLTAAQRAEKEKAVDDTKAAEEAKITAADDADKVEAAKTAGVTAIKAVHTVGSLDDVKAAAKALPNTGTVKSTLAIPVAITSALLSLGLVGGRRRKEDEEV